MRRLWTLICVLICLWFASRRLSWFNWWRFGVWLVLRAAVCCCLSLATWDYYTSISTSQSISTLLRSFLCVCSAGIRESGGGRVFTHIERDPCFGHSFRNGRGVNNVREVNKHSMLYTHVYIDRYIVVLHLYSIVLHFKYHIYKERQSEHECVWVSERERTMYINANGDDSACHSSATLAFSPLLPYATFYSGERSSCTYINVKPHTKHGTVESNLFKCDARDTHYTHDLEVDTKCLTSRPCDTPPHPPFRVL